MKSEVRVSDRIEPPKTTAKIVIHYDGANFYTSSDNPPANARLICRVFNQRDSDNPDEIAAGIFPEWAKKDTADYYAAALLRNDWRND